MKKDLKITHHPNATISKLHNKRVGVFSMGDSFVVQLKTLSSKEECDTPRSMHLNLKDKAVSTSIKVSEEAAYSLAMCLLAQLDVRGVEVKLPEQIKIKNVVRKLGAEEVKKESKKCNWCQKYHYTDTMIHIGIIPGEKTDHWICNKCNAKHEIK